MAKRKRLEVPSEPVSPSLETKSAVSAPRARMPIAEVASETAGRAALEEVAREMTAAEHEGRIVKKLAMDQIQIHHLSRDRMIFDPEDMAALTASIAERGQQTPIEVVRLSGGQFGLIAGLRRIEALRQLQKATVLALVRQPDHAQEAYRAMIEENEMRADLSFYERANIALATVGEGVYPTLKDAVAGLFAHASPSKRSKIAKFAVLRETLGSALRFPTAIPEKVGFALAQAIEADPKLAAQVSRDLKAAQPEDAPAERRVLDQALKRPAATSSARGEEIVPGVMLDMKKGRAVLSGAGVDASLAKALRAFIISHAKKPD